MITVLKDTLINLVENLLKKSKIPFDKEELKFQLQSHPSYPSLHAITGVLDHFRIENIAAEIPNNQETLQQLPETFIAQIKNDKGKELVTIHKAKNTASYTVFNESKKTEKITVKEFLKQFTGIVVAVEKNEANKPLESTNNNAKKYILIALLFLFITFLINNGVVILEQLYFLLAIAGIGVSYTIFKQELGEHTLLGDAFCSGNSEKRDCDNVLSSKGAQLFKNYKLSDLSMIYFIGLVVSFVLQINFYVFAVISSFALPITIYSIYYQYKIAKSWCLLCLTIVGILWTQGLIALIDFEFSVYEIASLRELLIISIGFISAYLIWGIVKPLISGNNELKKEKITLTKFKRNFEIFNNLLQKSTPYNTIIDTEDEIVFGNVNSNLELTIITNPFCGHCKAVHEHVDSILELYADKVKINIRFNINQADKNSDLFKITYRLLELFNQNGQGECLLAMNDIYGGTDPADWLKKWGESLNKEVYETILQKSKDWCINNGINFTPEILINGRSYPREYDRNDLIHFIEDLHENTY